MNSAGSAARGDARDVTREDFLIHDKTHDMEARPFERRFNSDSRVFFGRFVQAFLSGLDADVLHACSAPPTESDASQ